MQRARVSGGSASTGTASGPAGVVYQAVRWSIRAGSPASARMSSAASTPGSWRTGWRGKALAGAAAPTIIRPMFPRRRTDQVYATLQQVQRRITEQSGAPQTAATPAGMLPPATRTPVVGTPTPGPQPAIRPGPHIPGQDGPPAPPPLPLLPPGVAAHQRYAVVLSGTLATLLAVCWLASIAVAILITWQVTRPPVAMAGEAPIRTSAVQVEAAQAEPRFKLVVRSEPRATPEVRQALAKARDTLNDVMRRNAARGWQPLFEIEEGVNGAVMLVFGRQGVDRGHWQEFYALLTRQREYTGATWVEVR